MLGEPTTPLFSITVFISFEPSQLQDATLLLRTILSAQKLHATVVKIITGSQYF